MPVSIRFLQEAAAKRTREIEQEQEERLARELQRMNIEALRDEKLRQQLRQTSHELRGIIIHQSCAYWILLFNR